jgi:hypothetical protein
VSGKIVRKLALYKGSCAWRRISFQPGSFRLPQADMTRPSRKILQKYQKHRTHPKGAPKVDIALPCSDKYKVFQFEIGAQTHSRGSAEPRTNIFFLLR